MAINQDTIFYGRSFSCASIASISSRGVIPSVQMYLDGKTALKKPKKILQTYDVAENIKMVSTWSYKKCLFADC
jgi:hypothetical protein